MVLLTRIKIGSHDRIRTCTTNTLNVPPTANWATWPWKWWIQWDSNSHYTAPQAVDSANWSMNPLRRHDSFFTIPQTSPRILDLHQERLLRLLGQISMKCSRVTDTDSYCILRASMFLARYLHNNVMLGKLPNATTNVIVRGHPAMNTWLIFCSNIKNMVVGVGFAPTLFLV